jgi:hypothetical protein
MAVSREVLAEDSEGWPGNEVRLFGGEGPIAIAQQDANGRAIRLRDD